MIIYEKDENGYKSVTFEDFDGIYYEKGKNQCQFVPNAGCRLSGMRKPITVQQDIPMILRKKGM